MIGIHRRKRVEGWAQDVSEAESMGAPSTLRQRMGDDNRLWLIAVGLIVILAFLMVTKEKSGGGPVSAKAKNLPTYTGVFTDEKHQNFTRYFLDKKRYSSSVIDAGFISDGNFQVVMPSNASPDDIEYSSKMAAKLLDYKLRERAKVRTFLRNPSTGRTVQVATTKWDGDKSAYVITFEGETK